MRRFVVISLLATLVTNASAQASEESIRRADSAWARSYAQNDSVTAKALFDDRLIAPAG